MLVLNKTEAFSNQTWKKKKNMRNASGVAKREFIWKYYRHTHEIDNIGFGASAQTLIYHIEIERRKKLSNDQLIWWRKKRKTFPLIQRKEDKKTI